MSLCRREEGQAIVLLAISLPLILALLLLVIDGGRYYVERERLRNAAQLAAEAAVSLAADTQGRRPFVNEARAIVREALQRNLPGEDFEFAVEVPFRADITAFNVKVRVTKRFAASIQRISLPIVVEAAARLGEEGPAATPAPPAPPLPRPAPLPPPAPVATPTPTPAPVAADPCAAITGGVSSDALYARGNVLLNFDAVDASAGALDSTSYLRCFAVTLSRITAGTTVAIVRTARDMTHVDPASPPNIFTQIGSNNPVSYTLNFPVALDEVSFVRARLRAGPTGVSHPAWSAIAFSEVNAGGTRIAEVSEGRIAQFSDVPARSFILPSGPAGIRSVRFDRPGINTAGVSAAVLDDVALVPARGPRVITTVGVGSWPVAVALNTQTNRVYVANQFSDSVSVIDGAANRVVATVRSTPGRRLDQPVAVAVNPQTNRVYVANFGSHAVSVIDGSTNRFVTTNVSVGSNPHGVAIDPRANLLYVVNRGSNNITVIDTLKNRRIVTQTVGSSPSSVASAVPRFSGRQGSRVHVANSGSNTLATLTLLCCWRLAPAIVGVGSSPHAVAVDSQTSRVYVANIASNTVSVVDGSTRRVVATIGVGQSPGGLGVNPQTGRVYVANFGSGTVSVIDGGTNGVVATVRVGSNPVGVAVNPQTRRVYVANAGSGTVSVIAE